MRKSLKENYKARIGAAVNLSNYLNNPEYVFDADNLRYDQDMVVEAMANFLSAAAIYINETYSNSLFKQEDANTLKKEIMNAITCLGGVTLSFGKGLTVNKYIHVLNRIVSDMDPDKVIE